MTRRAAVLALAALGVLASAGWAAAQCPDGTPPPCGRPAAPARAPAPYSVAVLTFAMTGADTATGWMGDQLADEITGALGSVDRLDVRTRTLVRRQERLLAGDLRALSRALNVRYVVEGAVQTVGGRLRIRSQLVRAQDGHIAWSRPFGSASDSLLDAEQAIATAVATAIAGQLLPEEASRVARRPTTNDAAYRAYLRGNVDLARRTETGIADAARRYESALRFDPHFLRALGRLGYAHALAFSNAWGVPGVPRDSVAARGLALAAQALDLDRANADALLARGYIRQLEGDYRQARTDFRAAVAADPTNAEAWHRLGRVLVLPEEQSGAVAAYLRALALEPERAVTYADLTRMLLQQGRVDEAEFWSDSLVAMAPDHRYAFWSRVHVRLMRRDAGGARAAFDRIALQDRSGFWYLEADLLTMEGDTAGARRVLLGAQNTRTTAPFSVLSRLLVGDREGALDALAEAPAGGTGLILTSPFYLGQRFDARGDPRYERYRAACEAALR